MYVATHTVLPLGAIKPSKRFNPEYRWEEITEGWTKRGSPANERDSANLQPLPRQLSERIPLDVYECIMDYMDQASLYFAALVCRAWYHQGIRLLYQTIEIQQRAAFNTLSRKSPGVRERLASSKELRVMHRRGPPFCHVVPLTLGRAMPAVERLIFRACLRPLMHPTFARYLPSFAGVKELELCGFKFSSAAELRRVLCGFPRLAHLSLSRGEVAQDMGGHDQSKERQITHADGQDGVRIQTLVLGMHLNMPLLDALIDWLVVSSACQSTSRLEFWRDSLESVLSVNRLLEAISGALLDFHEHQGRFERRDHADLAHNYNLRNLDMTISRRLTETSGILWPELIDELMRVLSRVRSMNMSRILVHIVFRTVTWVGRMIPLVQATDTRPPPLYSVLESANYDLLEEVQTTVEVDSTDMTHTEEEDKAVAETKACQVVPYIRALLAPWHKRGILVVTPIYWNLRPSYGEAEFSFASGLLYAHQEAFYNPTYLPLGLLEPPSSHTKVPLDGTEESREADSRFAAELLLQTSQRPLYHPGYLPLGLLTPR